MADPYPKTRQLARGERRYRRKVASPKQWAAIRAEKLGRCRLCNALPFHSQLHHLVSRARGGDDVADNLIPLCAKCHELVTRLSTDECEALATELTDAEYAYCVAKLGEGAMGRLFNV